MKNLKKYLEIGKKFKKANDYANHATIQKQVLDELLDLIPNKDFKSVLELGSGSINNKKFYQKTLGIKDIYINDTSKNFFVDTTDENQFILYSYPKNFPTVYTRPELHALIQSE